MEALVQAMRNMGPMRLAVMGTVLLAMIGFFIWVTTKLASPNVELLYGGLSQNDQSSITSSLSSQGVPFEIRNGNEVWVPADQVSSLRLSLANQGIPGGGTLGYEIFDSTDGLSTTNFMQNVNLVRALEGELARTIESISSVSSARVHLVLPKRELFSRQKQEPSASIVLRMSGGNRLDNEQVLAVQHLVATAVPSLLPNRVSIVDNKGKLLAAGFEDEGDVSVMADKTAQRTRTYENRMARMIEELLEQTVGFGKVRAEVSAELDFDVVNTQEEIYDPDGQVVRSTQTIEQSAILVILLVVRPLISRAFEAMPSASQLAGERLLADQTATAAALTGPAGAPIPGDSIPEEEQFEELIDIDRVEGRVKASSVKKVGEIVEKHPEEALSIIRNWMYQET